MTYTAGQIAEFAERYAHWMDRKSDLTMRILTHIYRKDTTRTLAAHGLAGC